MSGPRQCKILMLLDLDHYNSLQDVHELVVFNSPWQSVRDTESPDITAEQEQDENISVKISSAEFSDIYTITVRVNRSAC